MLPSWSASGSTAFPSRSSILYPLLTVSQVAEHVTFPSREESTASSVTSWQLHARYAVTTTIAQTCLTRFNATTSTAGSISPRLLKNFSQPLIYPIYHFAVTVMNDVLRTGYFSCYCWRCVVHACINVGLIHQRIYKPVGIIKIKLCGISSDSTNVFHEDHATSYERWNFWERSTTWQFFALG